ncbi:medium-chain fatty acid-CoA ligase faa2, partial [Coemansia sp. RSA 1933]
SRRYTVGITDATGVESAETTFNNSESAVIVCSMDKIPRMLNRIKMAPTIKVIISMDSLDLSKPSISTQALSAETISELRKQAESAGVALLDMAEVIEMGRQTPTHANLPEPADICVVCYTSGTLAAQKGVVRTHAANVFASKCAYLSGSLSDSTYLSFIPITHCVDRNTIYALMYEHTRIGMSSGVPENLMNDFQTLRPTVFLAAPPILNKVYEKAAAATISAAGMIGMLSRYAYSSKLQQFKGGSGTKHAFWDMLLFGKVAQIFGGRVRTVYCGGSSLMPEVQDFFRIALSCDLIQGYGQTETFGCGTLQLTTDTTTGNIGVPMPGIDMRLRSVPDMDLSAESPVCPKGELMIRGKCLFSGYLKQPENSKDLVDDEGWMATDDIAQFNEDERDLVAVVSPEREQFIEWAQRYLSNTNVTAITDQL